MRFTSISDIVLNASQLSREDVEKIIPDVAKFYEQRIDRLAVRAYGSGLGEVAKNAFRAYARVTLHEGMSTFIFTKEHWRTGRDMNPYLLLCLRRLADRLFYEQASTKKQSSLICPGCRELPGNPKVLLVAEAKVWRCTNCTSELDRLQDDQRHGRVPVGEQGNYQSRIGIHKNFAVHSRRGFRCPDPECARFIPESMNGRYGIACPYSDCSFFGQAADLIEMAHPVSLTVRQNLSLNQTVQKGDAGGATTTELQDFFAAEEIPPDEKISMNQSFEKEYKILLEVIESQMQTVRRMNNNGTRTQKLLMYEAFKRLCFAHPDEMVSYLVHLKQSAEVPLQPRIFQEYVALMEDALPITLERRGEEIEIISISDPELGLFIGKSEFTAVVGKEGAIPNNTIETYVGNRMYINHGPCYLGRLIDVQSKDGKSLLSEVKSYSFVQIESFLPEGTEVTVKHYRIPAHYEMLSLVFLQRIRRHIVDRVYWKLHGVKRPVGRKNAEAA